MTTPLRGISLLFDDPGELVAAIPGLLRFAPTDSIVLITYSGGRTLGLEAVLRMDLPAPEHVDDVIGQLGTVVANHEATMVELVVFGGGNTDPPGVPHHDLVEGLTESFDRAGVTVAHAIWTAAATAGAPWRCYRDPECAGVVRDPTGSPLVAAVNGPGAVTFASREELAAQLAPDPPDRLARRLALFAALPAVDAGREISFLRTMVDGIGSGEPEPDDATVVRIAHALSCPDVREACLAMALTARARPAERMWTVLTRAVPGQAVAVPAALLAVCAYLRGEGALAGVAVDIALAADPDHPLSHTMREVMDHGIPPHRFRSMLAESFLAALTHRPPDQDPEVSP
jgi:hypothetical protein